jgi:hypothetical protein
MFYFFGKILGKGLFDHIPVNVCLNRSIFKALVGKAHEIDYKDLEEFKNVDFNVIIPFDQNICNRYIIV